MKILSLKLDDEVFNEAEKITTSLNVARNRYINEAVNLYNRVNKRRLLKKQLSKESELVSKEWKFLMNLKCYWMKINQFDIWLADLNPSRGTEPGKTRPVVILQTDLLNDSHPSTIICPITSNVQKNSDILRVHLKKNQLEKMSDILVDQIRAIDNKRLINRIGELTKEQKVKLKENLRIVLDI